MPKPINPQQRYQAGVVREAKIASLLHSTKEQESYLAIAKWESALGSRDVSSRRKWDDGKMKEEAKMTNDTVKMVRRSKLEELYRNDNLMYEQELNRKGLAIRQERT